jgi:hypothetical protein
VADVLHTTECELKEAIDTLRQRITVGEQLIKVTYDLDVVETGKGTGSAGFTIPISNGTFSLGLSAGQTEQHTRKTSFTLEYESKRLRCNEGTGPDAPRRLEGDLGLSDWLLKTAGVLWQADETPTAMTYQVGFDLTRNAELKPAIGVAFTDGHKYGADLTLTGSRQTRHSILVAAATIKGVSARSNAQARRDLELAIQQALLRDND